jgi:hypothetical protein
METNTRAQDILEFIIFVGLRDELRFLESMNLGFVRVCCKVVGTWWWGLVLVPLNPPCPDNKRIWTQNQN